MPPRERTVDRGTRLARRALGSLGSDLRTARLSSGLTLAQVGRAAGMSYTTVGRIERAEYPSVTVAQLTRVGAAVGLDVRVRTYPGPDPIRDAAQVALMERLRGRLHPGLRFRTEVPLPLVGDLRAWDGWISRLRPVADSGTSMPAEAETRIADVQGLLRRLMLKQRDASVAHALLVVADTTANRSAVRAARPTFDEHFPIPARHALAALAAGVHPGGSALVFL